jgi:hypothetical protein
MKKILLLIGLVAFSMSHIKAETVYLDEDFSWLTYGQVAWQETSGEKALQYWTDAEKAKGWTSIVSGTNTAWKGAGYTYVYGRPGFIKLGATNYGGNIVTPDLKDFGDGTADIKVTFHALGYPGTGNATNHVPNPIDANDLYVGLWGDGEIGTLEGTNETYSFTTEELGDVSLKVIHYSLNYANSVAGQEHGENFDSWSDDYSGYEVTVSNATKNTHVVFFAGPFYDGLTGRGSEKVDYNGVQITKNNNINRVYMDNIKIVAASSAIENIAVDENAPIEYYNLQGVRVANPENGVYITKQGRKVAKKYIGR